MTATQLLSEIVKQENWYKPLGWSPAKGNTYKYRFSKGMLMEKTIHKILKDLGCKQIWVKEN